MENYKISTKYPILFVIFNIDENGYCYLEVYNALGKELIILGKITNEETYKQYLKQFVGEL